MALFKPHKTAPAPDEPPPASPASPASPAPLGPDLAAVRALALAAAEREGLSIDPDASGPDWFQLVDGDIINLQRLFGIAAAAAPADWPELVSQWSAATLESMRATPAEQLGEEELRQRIRARLWPTIGTDLEDFPYARRIVTGLAQVLCLDYPTSVACLMGDRPHHLALPIDELYAQGLANVLAEPCPAPQQTSIEGLFEISDGSLWIASKAASFGSLVPDVIGPAPRGAFLMVPRDDLLCYAPVVGEDWMRLPGIVANLAMALAREAHSEGAMLSPIAYYWAPDGTLERCSGNSPEGELAVTPGPAFTRYLLEVGTDQ